MMCMKIPYILLPECDWNVYQIIIQAISCNHNEYQPCSRPCRAADGFRGFVDLLRLSNADAVETVPGTLEFDGERIVKLRSNLVNAVNLEACMSLFDSLMTGGSSSNSAYSSTSSTFTQELSEYSICMQVKVCPVN
jgi:hypothetical protein